MFTDVPDTLVFHDDISDLAYAGITRGCSPPANDAFCPDDPVTRGQMAAFLHRALPDLPTAPAVSFTDTSGHIFQADIVWLASTGVTRGCNPPANTAFCPDDPVTRGQMAAFLVRALGYTDGAGSDRFTDDDDSVFEADIERLAHQRVTFGCTTTMFCPDDAVTRGEMAAFLARALDLPTAPHNRTSNWRLWHVDLVGEDPVLFARCDATDPARIDSGSCYAETTALPIVTVNGTAGTLPELNSAVNWAAPGGGEPGLPVRVTLAPTDGPRQGAFGDNAEVVVAVTTLQDSIVDCKAGFSAAVDALDDLGAGYFVDRPLCTDTGWAVAPASVGMSPIWEIFEAFDVDANIAFVSTDVGSPYPDMVDTMPAETAAAFMFELWADDPTRRGVSAPTGSGSSSDQRPVLASLRSRNSTAPTTGFRPGRQRCRPPDAAFDGAHDARTLTSWERSPAATCHQPHDHGHLPSRPCRSVR